MKTTVRTVPAATQMDGVPVLLLVRTPLQPPLAVADASHAAYCASSCAWVRHALAVVFAGQFNTTFGEAATVNVAWQVVVNGSQELA